MIDELVAGFIRGEFEEGVALFLGDDVNHIAIKPFAIHFRKLLFAQFLGLQRRISHEGDREKKRERCYMYDASPDLSISRRTRRTMPSSWPSTFVTIHSGFLFCRERAGVITWEPSLIPAL